MCGLGIGKGEREGENLIGEGERQKEKERENQYSQLPISLKLYLMATNNLFDPRVVKGWQDHSVIYIRRDLSPSRWDGPS